jgi:hypothetical protein
MCPYALQPEDDDWGQVGTLVRRVMDDAERDCLVSNIVGHLLDGVTGAGAATGVRAIVQLGRGSGPADREGCPNGDPAG